MKLKREINNFMDEYNIQLTDIVEIANLFSNKEIKYHTVYKYIRGINQSISYEVIKAILKAIDIMRGELYHA